MSLSALAPSLIPPQRGEGEWFALQKGRATTRIAPTWIPTFVGMTVGIPLAPLRFAKGELSNPPP